jgi:hypothetical protein
LFLWYDRGNTINDFIDIANEADEIPRFYLNPLLGLQ